MDTYRCPKCKKSSEMFFDATIELQLDQSGGWNTPTPNDWPLEYDDFAPAHCEACGWEGTLDDLKVPDTE